MVRVPPQVAWLLCGIAIATALGLGFLLLNERHANDAERARLAEARDSLQREETRARQLTDQMTALQQQLAALGDRVGGLEQSNRDLQKRLAVARRPPTRTEVAALAFPSGPASPEISLLDALPSIELYVASLVGEPSLPLTGVNLAPSSEWPMAERFRIPRAAHPLTDPVVMNRMYAGYAAMQAADIASTVIAIRRGGYEANPLIRGIADKPAALVAVKMATGISTYVLLERLRKNKPMTAAIALAAFNSTLAVVTANNIKTAARKK